MSYKRPKKIKKITTSQSQTVGVKMPLSVVHLIWNHPVAFLGKMRHKNKKKKITEILKKFIKNERDESNFRFFFKTYATVQYETNVQDMCPLR
jgi:hypothetical protein